jgi:hypothetical protein
VPPGTTRATAGERLCAGRPVSYVPPERLPPGSQNPAEEPAELGLATPFEPNVATPFFQRPWTACPRRGAAAAVNQIMPPGGRPDSWNGVFTGLISQMPTSGACHFNASFGRVAVTRPNRWMGSAQPGPRPAQRQISRRRPREYGHLFGPEDTNLLGEGACCRDDDSQADDCGIANPTRAILKPWVVARPFCPTYTLRLNGQTCRF